MHKIEFADNPALAADVPSSGPTEVAAFAENFCVDIVMLLNSTNAH